MVPYGSNLASPRPEYHNVETMAWFQLRDLMAREPVSLPDDPEVFEQLANRMFTYVPATMKYKVESKKEYKDRTKQGSPDKADAIVQLFYDSERDDSPPGADPSGQSRRQREMLAPTHSTVEHDDYGVGAAADSADLWTFIG